MRGEQLEFQQQLLVGRFEAVASAVRIDQAVYFDDVIPEWRVDERGMRQHLQSASGPANRRHRHRDGAAVGGVRKSLAHNPGIEGAQPRRAAALCDGQLKERPGP